MKNIIQYLCLFTFEKIMQHYRKEFSKQLGQLGLGAAQLTRMFDFLPSFSLQMNVFLYFTSAT